MYWWINSKGQNKYIGKLIKAYCQVINNWNVHYSIYIIVYCTVS